jgi:nucleotide-binding universal stress UspA family protein
MKKILFPTDFSEASKNAFIYALKLADAIDAEIITLHVFELDSPAFLDVSIYLKEIYGYKELSDFENFKDEIPVLRDIAKANDLEHIKISNVIIQGYLVTEVAKIVKSKNIDFIVMGTKGVTQLREVFLGTVTTKLINECNTTVLAIPEKCSYMPITRILFNTRYNLNDIEPLKKVEALATIFQAHIDCLNIKIPHKVQNDDFESDFKNIFKDSNITFHSALGNDIETVILNYIEQNGINMVAIHERHRGFLEKLFQVSLSRKLAFDIKIPFLSVH